MQLICALMFILTVCPSLGFLDCSVTGDGVFEKGCKAFIKCDNGIEEHIECPINEVFNPIKLRCDHPKNVIPPCGHIIDCRQKEDGHYPDLDQRCQTYYTCNGGTFYGHNFCPGDLVFNTEIGVCDWPRNVYYPCGLLPFIPPTQVPTTSTPKPTTTASPTPTTTATPTPTTAVPTTSSPNFKLLNKVAFIDTLASDKLLKNLLSIKD